MIRPKTCELVRIEVTLRRVFGDAVYCYRMGRSEMCEIHGKIFVVCIFSQRFRHDVARRRALRSGAYGVVAYIRASRRVVVHAETELDICDDGYTLDRFKGVTYNKDEMAIIELLSDGEAEFGRHSPEWRYIHATIYGDDPPILNERELSRVKSFILRREGAEA